MSHWLYIHEDMGGEPDVYKPGIAMLPYSAVRARQKFVWKKFELTHLYFGRSEHIKILEHRIKKNFYECSGQAHLGNGAQTELFKVKETELLMYIQHAISTYNLDVKKILLKEPYSASSSGKCPFECPPERDAKEWCEEKVNAWFGPATDLTSKKKVNSNNYFNELFSFNE